MKDTCGSISQRPAPLVLVVEDEFLIAMELQAVLAGAGFDVLGPAASISTALAHLEHQSPDSAVLDVSLGGERVSPVAQLLKTRGIPFVLTSAYGPAELQNEPVLSNAVNLGKPTSGADLIKALQRLLAKSCREGT